MALCRRVEVGSDRIDITLSLNRLAGLLNASLDLEAQQIDQTKEPDDILRLRAPASLKRVGRGMRMLVDNVDAPGPPTLACCASCLARTPCRRA